MIDSEHVPAAVGIVGVLSSLTLGDINELVAIAVGLTTLVYLVVRIVKEIKNK